MGKSRGRFVCGVRGVRARSARTSLSSITHSWNITRMHARTPTLEHRYKVRVHTDEKSESSSSASYTYKVAAVVKIHLRRYRLRESALEIFLERQCRRSSAFFHFVGDDGEVRNDLVYVFRRLVSRPRLVQTPDLVALRCSNTATRQSLGSKDQ